MRAIVVRCPQCHASLKVDDALASTRCEYCGTHARVQRTTMFGARVGPPPPEAVRGLPVAIERARTTVAWVMLTIGIAIALGVFLVVRTVRRAIPSQVRDLIAHGVPAEPGAPARPPTIPTAPSAMGWNGGGEPIFVDVNGDGARDAIGLVRYVLDGDRMMLGAIDGKTGALLWESERLGTYTETYQGHLYAPPAGTGPARLLFAHPRGELHAFEVKTGARAWTRQLGERVKSLCLEGDALALALINGQWLRVDPTGGQVAPRARPGKGCASLRQDGDELDDGPDVRTSRARVRVAGMSRGDVLEHVPSGVVVAAGSRSPGTSVPMLARVDADGGARWKAEVPAEDPFDARAERHTISATRACSLYAHGVRGYHVTCFGLEDGSRLWDRELVADHIVVRGLSDVDGTVFVSAWGHLYGLDGATGAPRFAAGR